jgi:hypothetical protein
MAAQHPFATTATPDHWRNWGVSFARDRQWIVRRSFFFAAQALSWFQQ